MKCHSLLARVACLALLGPGCAADLDDADDAGGELVEEFLSSTTPGCFDWANVDKTLTEGGEFVSPATYDNATCFQAYLLNLVDYRGAPPPDPCVGCDKYNRGAVVAFAGTIPTNQAACTAMQVRALVWRKNGSNMVYAGKKHTNGRWIAGADGTSRCLIPAVNLERDIGIVPNGFNDYRVAMTVRDANDNTQPFAFVTVEEHVITPVDEMQNLVAYRALLDQHSGTNLDPYLAALWATRGTQAGQIACRRIQVDRGLHGFARAATVKAGASDTTTGQRITALGNIYSALCTPGGTATNLHNAFKDYLTRTISMRDQIRTALQNEMPAGSAATFDKLTANLMSQIPEQALGNLISKCDLDADPLTAYLSSGVLPAGVTDATRVVLGACSNQSPTQAASGIGFGTTVAGSNPVQQMAECMTDLASAATELTCSDPRASGAPLNPPQEPTDICWDGKAYKACSSIQKAELDAVKERVANLEADNAALREAAIHGSAPTPEGKVEAAEVAGEHPGTQIAHGVAMAAEVVAWGAAYVALGDVEPATKATAAVVAVAAKGVNILAKYAADTGVAAELYDAAVEAVDGVQEDVRQWCKSSPEAGAFCDTFDGDDEYCPPDDVLPSGGWYQVGTGGPTQEHQANVQDLFNHCLCDMVDADYAAIGRVEAPARAPATSCPKSDEQRKLECVADPRMQGDDDRPNPACLRLLAPEYDANVWTAKECWTKQCGSLQRPFAMPNGECECHTINPSGGFPDCNLTPRASSGLCTEDAPQACFCQEINLATPNGADPFCRHDPTVLPGPLSAWLAPDLDAVRVEQFTAATSLLRVRTGGNTQFVSPTLFPTSFAQRGTKIREKVALFKAPAQGQNVDLKLYYTNRERNVHRQFMGQCRMNSFAVGALTNCDFDLPTIGGVNAGTFVEPFELEMEVDTAVQYTSRPGLGPISYAGTLFNTPAAVLAPACPAPAPSNELAPVDVFNPFLPPGNLINPNQFYPIPNGTLLEVPLSIMVIR